LERIFFLIIIDILDMNHLEVDYILYIVVFEVYDIALTQIKILFIVLLAYKWCGLRDAYSDNGCSAT
jgi:hypothetical protein